MNNNVKTFGDCLNDFMGGFNIDFDRDLVEEMAEDILEQEFKFRALYSFSKNEDYTLEERKAVSIKVLTSLEIDINSDLRDLMVQEFNNNL